jgi:hypothetical protein
MEYQIYREKKRGGRKKRNKRKKNWWKFIRASKLGNVLIDHGG